MSLEWYAVHTRSRHEQKVSGRLTDKSIHTFLPKIEVWSRRRDRRKRMQIPLFPGYLFVNVELDNYICLDILKTPGVAYIVGNNGKCHPIPGNQIVSIQNALAKGALLTSYPYLKVGRRVRVVNGPLTGCEGILLRYKTNKQRLIMSVDLLGQSLSTEIDEADVEPA